MVPTLLHDECALRKLKALEAANAAHKASEGESMCLSRSIEAAISRPTSTGGFK